MNDGALLDTSAWLALFEDRDAPKGLDAVAHARPIVNYLAHAEIASLRLRGKITGDTQALTDLMERAPCELMHEDDPFVAARIHAAARKDPANKASLVDCLMLAMAQRLGIPYVTLDRDLQHERGVVLLTRAKPTS